MDQQPKMQREEEEEEDDLKESTGRRTEEEGQMDRREEEKKSGSEEPTTDQQRKAAAAAEEEEEEKERSSDGEGSMEEVAASLSLHPCSLLQYVVRAFACRLGISDPFGGTKPSGDSAPLLSPSAQGHQDTDEKNPSTANGFYMQGVITTRLWAVRWRPHPRPAGPDDPVEGSGGNGGHHH